MPAFTAREFLRYSRHLQLPEFGVAGQLALKNSHAVIIGCGGLGAPVAQYLAAAGVGLITLVDGDHVELSNLQRQVLFTETDIGHSKAECAARRLSQLNSDIELRAVQSHLSTENCDTLLGPADIVVDCTDNFSARYLINDLCKRLGTPWVYASIFQYSGQLAVFSADGPCFRCLFPDPPKNVADCNTAGVLGALPGILGSLQSAEVLRILSGTSSSLQNHLLMVESSDFLFQKFAMRKNESCPVCNGQLDELNTANAYTPFCADDSLEPGTDTLSLGSQEFEQHRQTGPGTVIVDVRTIAERNAFNLGGEHIELEKVESWLETADASQTLVFYCQSGARSSRAAVLAVEKGFRARSLKGGLQSYLEATL